MGLIPGSQARHSQNGCPSPAGFQPPGEVQKVSGASRMVVNLEAVHEASTLRPTLNENPALQVDA